MRLRIYALITAEFKAAPIHKFTKHLTGQEFVDYINAIQPYYKAQLPKMSEKEFRKRLMHPIYVEKLKKAPRRLLRKPISLKKVRIPKSFDARKEWSDCDSITLIRDQSGCGACWAIAVASAMSDRYCITKQWAKGYGFQVILSDTEILACCDDCAINGTGTGCTGGYAHKALEYLVDHGTVSGGMYTDRVMRICNADHNHKRLIVASCFKLKLFKKKEPEVFITTVMLH
ncbi:unnamed protein product [Strongylus vulgaris]|uniref:Peptidase C1A papain C-terminal domain-containing protein n=1 Tax=Strongylus vulgaris TaxID=40348 RepID=A0A3P7J3V0_STRVU|nr:unnamed protein product [Strongylus vulgaris]